LGKWLIFGPRATFVRVIDPWVESLLRAAEQCREAAMWVRGCGLPSNTYAHFVVLTAEASCAGGTKASRGFPRSGFDSWGGHCYTRYTDLGLWLPEGSFGK
jgi:hypothetical protein